MWRIEEHHRVVDKQIDVIPTDILKRYEKWKDIAVISGPTRLWLIKGFHDEALGERVGGNPWAKQYTISARVSRTSFSAKPSTE